MTRRVLALPAVIAGIGLLLTACGGSSGNKPSSGSSGSPTSAATSSPASSPAAAAGSAAATIKTNWEAFFSASTPTAKRVALLQNGSHFASVIAAQAKSSLASSASAKVTGVSNVTSSQAAVAYSILVAGSPVLKNQSGVAVKQDGTWKVGDKSFCGLLSIENGGKIQAALKPLCSGSAG